MSRLLVVLVVVVALPVVLTWVLTHFGVIVLGAGGWWMGSRWSGRRDV